MIPYIELRTVRLGPVEIHVFGALLLLGMIVFHVAFVRRARALGLLRGWQAEGIALATLAGGIVGTVASSRLLFPMLVGTAPRLAGDAGLSSLATALVATTSLLTAASVVGLPWRSALDLAASALPRSWVVARLGCVLVHDHPGRESTSMLAVRFPEGPRFDLAVTEWLGVLPLLALVMLLEPRRLARGRLAGIVAIGSGALRFLVELQRGASDAEGWPELRAGPFTIGQLVCVGAVLGGVALLALPESRHGPPPAT